MNEKKKPSNEVFYKPGLYALTMSLDDKHQFIGDPLRISKVTNYYSTLLSNLHKNLGIEYYAYYELSEPRNNMTTYNTVIRAPRWHIHGILKLKDEETVVNFLSSGYAALSMNAVLEIDSIKDVDIWIDYIQKQQKFRGGCISIPPISNLTKLKYILDPLNLEAENSKQSVKSQKLAGRDPVTKKLDL